MTSQAQLPTDFSLVLGGPLYQLMRRSRLAGDGLQLLRRRIVALTVLAWVPLLLFSAAEGLASGGVTLPFLYDAEQHLRLLVSIPLMILGEMVVHRRLRSVLAQFVERDLVPGTARVGFDAAVSSAMRLRNSIWAEVGLIVFVYVVGVGFVWPTQVVIDVASWHGSPVNGGWQPSMAGWWLRCVSLPLFQFLLLRWYFRLFIWARFLWQVSRLDLALMPTHPDRCGGIGFLGATVYAFAPVLAAQGAVLAGMMANRIFYAGARLPEFKVELIGLVALMLLTVLGPLLVFSPKLEAAKRAGLRAHGILAQRYVRDYDRKWLQPGAPPDEPLVGSADIQSLADLGNSYEVIRDMRWVPFTVTTVLQLALTTLLPVLPLTLTMISLEELLERLLEAVF